MVPGKEEADAHSTDVDDSVNEAYRRPRMVS